MRSSRLASALFLLTPLLQGCFGQHAVQATSRTGSPANEVAVIRAAEGSSWDDSAVIFIVEVDSVSVRKGDWIWDRVSEVTVDPGVHVIGITARIGEAKSAGVMPIKVAVDAGRVYEIRGASVDGGFGESVKKALIGGGRWRAWVVDVESGVVVAGAAPKK